MRPFSNVFGDTPEIRLIYTLLPIDGELTSQDLKEYGEMNRITSIKLLEVISKLVEYGFISIKKDVTRLRYLLDPVSPMVKQFQVLDYLVLRRSRLKHVIKEREKFVARRESVQIRTQQGK